ncbi:MAG: oligosaccharide flippase family protein, partial [Fidelibacterota bacterium]
MRLKTRTTVDFFYLLTSSILGQGLRMVRSFIVARLIGPLMFGTIQGLGIFLLYVPLIQLGYFQSMSRELPKRLQAGDQDAVQRINNNGLFMAFFAGLVGLLVYLAIFAVQGPSMSVPGRTAWLLFAGMVALGPVTLFYQMIYNAYGKFVTVSKIKIANSVVFFLLLGLVLAWDYVGQLLSLLLAAVM